MLKSGHVVRRPHSIFRIVAVVKSRCENYGACLKYRCWCSVDRKVERLTFQETGEFLKFEHPVGDSIIDLGESRHKMGRRDPIRLPGPVFQN